MQIGMVGLGRMGANMTRRLMQAGHQVVAYDLDADAVKAVGKDGALPADNLRDLVGQLSSPRAIWMMVPAGAPTQATVDELLPLLAGGDILLDGGNSNYQESMARASAAAGGSVQYLDVGVSGGIWGLKKGYGLMIGGPTEAVTTLATIFQALAPAADRGWAHVGPSGAGHFVKMVHNGIEYGLMQAYAEGFAILQAKDEFGLDLHRVAEAWRHGTVIRSWLLDLTARALEADPALDQVGAYVDDSGEGRWTVNEAVALGVPAPVISHSLFARFRSRRPDNYADKLLAAMRHQFGGHAIHPD